MSQIVNRDDFSDDLKRWQALSHGTLINRNPEDLFEPSFADLYKRLHENIWKRMVLVHGTIYSLEQLRAYFLLQVSCVSRPLRKSSNLFDEQRVSSKVRHSAPATKTRSPMQSELVAGLCVHRKTEDHLRASWH